MREYYDLWPEFSSHLSWKGRLKERTRRALIHRVDKHLLNKAQRRFVISATIQARLRQWGNISSDVLYPPPPARDYRSDAYDEYIFAVSRLTPHKRFDLLLRALAEPIAAGIRCVIAGEGAQLRELLRLRGNLDLADRVEFVGRLDDAELTRHFARCRAVVFPPWNEDYGIVTVESFMCAKPVITCRDSGGVAELVRDGENGFVAEPTPEALARAIRAVIDDRNRAISLGESGRADAMRMTWPDAIAKLVL
jgi:glycosyltransferase involved in cell wall biosynthesis